MDAQTLGSWTATAIVLVMGGCVSALAIACTVWLVQRITGWPRRYRA